MIAAVQGPESDQDDESELSVAELKVQREGQKKEVEVLRQLEAKEMEELVQRKMKAEQDVGCTWGFGTCPQFLIVTSSVGTIYHIVSNISILASYRVISLSLNTWSKSFDKRPHAWGIFYWGKFNVALDCFCT